MTDFSQPNPAARPVQHRRLRRTLWLCGAVLLLLAGFMGLTAARVERQAACDETRAADAIVVFGAAEYAGRPSPVFRARLDHAFNLFQQGIAPIVITTGGAGNDPKFSEGQVGRDYLIARGIPDINLIAETQSGDTAQSAERVTAILRANGITRCVAVSDAYHMYRVKQLLRSEGLTAFASPRPDSIPRTGFERGKAALREAFSYLLWELHLT